MKIAVLAGDGIGPEITAEAERVIAALASDGLRLETEHAAVGGAGYDSAGDPLPESTLRLCEQSDAILFGAVGGPKYDSLPRPKRPEQGLLRLRKHFDLFANLRPAMVYPELAHASSLRPEIVAGLDILILRELTGDIYFGQPRGIRTNEAGEREGFDTMRYSEGEIRRIAELAWGSRDAFLTGERHPIDDALAIALRGPAPFVLADAGDATNGGSTGGSTVLLRAALAHPDRRIALTVTDPSAAATLRAVPLGSSVTVTIGAGEPAAFDAPVSVTGTVLAHPDGRFTYSHPFSRGVPADLGTSAVLGVGELRVAVHALPVGVIDPEAYRAAGLDPARFEVLQAKSHVSYRAGFATIGERSVVAATPGPTTADLASLPWRRRPRPL